MGRITVLGLTALAPIVWGSTYLVTTEMLPAGIPLTLAVLRALPAGLLLILVLRKLPEGIWWLRVVILGVLNFSLFWWLLFIAAYRLPGGVAATVGAVQPLIVLFLSYWLLNNRLSAVSIIASIAGVFGVAILLLTPNAALDPLGIVAGLAGAFSMAAGTVLSRRWQPPVSALTFTSWQLTAGGLVLLPFAIVFEPALPPLSSLNLIGLGYLTLIGGALTYALWFRGLAILGPSSVASLGFLSPVSAVVLGWFYLNQQLSTLQFIGMVVILLSVWASQRAETRKVTLAYQR
ncbi:MULTISPECIES: EamA family transporter [Providencia]|uniref:EamA family transporter n=3 Tax=Morganellaceae TaxID=1903414 RepID=A0A264W0K1_PRORE|nr:MULTISPECIES: EamA family transporter [Providencia]EFE55675.1 Carboxylate/Amino Acid/Amine Transporter [Providencia rettgeri DSM 1131]EHZ6872473.1 EamA family transporter [Providencia rettgeri]MBN6364055.1 EamA family transporter [Providencia rettgeri]MBN7840369.1 EamA family transporter [Providencia rettgeri]MBN7852953.1 EamA family transporter [Providencia rettgeri]